MSAPFTPPVYTANITAGGTAQLLIDAATPDTPRNTLFIQPQTEACLVNFGITAGTQATGTLTAGANPVATETIAVNGVTFTFIAGASTSTDVQIGASKEATMTNLAAVLNASANASISIATYTVSGAILTVTYDAGGVDGNAFTLANSSGTAAITRSGATLAGGSNSVGGIYLAQNTMFLQNARDLPSIKEAVYVLSASDNAKINYTYG